MNNGYNGGIKLLNCCSELLPLLDIMVKKKGNFRRALSSGGSCTGEHGIGISKRKYLENECGKVAVNTMIAIKKALDPKGIMNPNELFPKN